MYRTLLFVLDCIIGRTYNIVYTVLNTLPYTVLYTSLYTVPFTVLDDTLYTNIKVRGR